MQGANPNQLLFVVSGACYNHDRGSTVFRHSLHCGETPVWITWGHLYGDTNANAIVNAGDSTQTKGRSGQTTDGTNFRSDVNTDGIINAGDSAFVKARSGTALALTRERIERD